MILSRSRIETEKKAVKIMIGIYCRKKHNSKNLCPDCTGLLAYSWKRLNSCPYKEKKSNCSHCPIHCYKPDMRQKIREVMRFSGPRMLWKHPLLILLHHLDDFRTRDKDKNKEKG